MELIYIHIDKYRNFEPTGIHLSNKFKVDYNSDNQTINIVKNDEYVNYYGGNITNISAIVGKNASGKTSLLDLIGKILISKNSKNDPNNKFLLIYYIETNINEDDLFIIETTNYDTDRPVIANINNVIIRKRYIKNCVSITRQENSKRNKFENQISVISFKNEIDMMKENAEISFKKVVLLENQDLYEKIYFIIKIMQNEKTNLYNDEKYTLTIDFVNKGVYHHDFIVSFFAFASLLDLPSLAQKEKAIIFFSFNYILSILHIFAFEIVTSYDTSILFTSVFENNKSKISNINSFNEVVELFSVILEESRQSFINSTRDEVANNITPKQTFLKLVDIFKDFLENYKKNNIEVTYNNENSLEITFNKDSNISEFKDFFYYILQGKTYDGCELKGQKISNAFKEPNIFQLSDGEKANLSMFTSIDLQIREYTKEKKNYILLFDEIERSMHPEMCRQLIFTLIKFLSKYEDKTFQIIIASHSPFIISDIPKENVVCLKREGENIEYEQCKIDTFGQNIHTILKNEFFMDSTMGDFAKSKITWIAEQLKTSDDKEKATEKDGESANTKPDLIYINKIINSIGEPIIKNYLLDLYNKYVDSKANKSEKEKLIEYHRSKLEELENGN